MYRYYGNIVAKYGKFVQAALKKASGLTIDYICSTHGPVWHDRVNQTVSFYAKLSSWEPEEGTVLIFSSMYGNTAELVDRMCVALSDAGLKNIRVYNAATAELSYMISDCVRYKNIIVGSPTYCMDIFPPVNTLVKALQVREIKNKNIAVFGSYTWANSASKKLAEIFTQAGCAPVAELVMKQSWSDGMAEDLKKFAETIAEANAR